LRATHLATSFGFIPESLAGTFLRKRIAPMILKNRWLQRAVTAGVSQVRIARREIKSRSG
jgi:hypothetical protein